MSLTKSVHAHPIDILFVEDDPKDVELTREALLETGIDHQLHVVSDGAEALAFLRRQDLFHNAPRPTFVLADLNLPGVDGHTLLETIKSDEESKSIPVIIFSTSEAEEDVARSYGSSANSYIAKPDSFEEFVNVMRSLLTFWSGVAELPTED